MEITDIDGILCNGIKEGKFGLGLVKFSGSIAGVFTGNRIKAAPVIVCSENIRKGYARGLIVNSGNANAFTGEQGLMDAREMCRIAAKLFGCREDEVAVASTGVIGRKLDVEMDKKEGGGGIQWSWQQQRACGKICQRNKDHGQIHKEGFFGIGKDFSCCKRCRYDLTQSGNYALLRFHFCEIRKRGAL